MPVSRSMHTALADLKLDELHVVYPAEKHYPVTDCHRVVPLAHFVNAQ